MLYIIYKYVYICIPGVSNDPVFFAFSKKTSRRGPAPFFMILRHAAPFFDFAQSRSPMRAIESYLVPCGALGGPMSWVDTKRHHSLKIAVCLVSNLSQSGRTSYEYSK